MDTSIFPLAKTDLGPAVKTLVKKIASATGTVYHPLGTIFQALADVTADKIRAKGEIEVEGVRKRALERLAAEETKKQQNLEAIYGKTYQLLDSAVDSATIDQMDDDWIVYHSEKARLISDEEMQTLWARVLASEAQTPGSYSRRALEMLSVLGRRKLISLRLPAGSLSVPTVRQSLPCCIPRPVREVFHLYTRILA